MALRSSASQILRFVRVASAACVALSTLAMSAAPADAHAWRHYHRHFQHWRDITGLSGPAAGRARQSGLRRHRRRRQYRAHALCRQRERAAPPRLHHQGDDALSLVRAARQRRPDAAVANSDLRARRRAGALQARRPARRHDLRRGRDQGDRHPFGQRRRGRHRGEDRRRRERVRRNDDPQGARPGHVAHPLPQRIRPAQRRAAHHRARPDDPRPRHRRALSALLQVFFDATNSNTTARSSAITITCSAASTASTASRPATPAPPASTS